MVSHCKPVVNNYLGGGNKASVQNTFMSRFHLEMESFSFSDVFELKLIRAN